MSVQALNKCLVLEFKYEDDFFLVGFPSIFDLELLGEVIIEVFRGGTYYRAIVSYLCLWWCLSRRR